MFRLLRPLFICLLFAFSVVACSAATITSFTLSTSSIVSAGANGDNTTIGTVTIQRTQQEQQSGFSILITAPGQFLTMPDLINQEYLYFAPQQNSASFTIKFPYNYSQDTIATINAKPIVDKLSPFQQTHVGFF